MAPPPRSGRERVAFLGLGIMGAPMAANLLRDGLQVVAWNRTREKAERLCVEHGASVAGSPAEAAAQASVAITMLPDGPEVERVLLGESGVAEGMAPGGLCIDMSTIRPAASRAIAGWLHDRELSFLDAPVTGSRPKAEDAALTIMAGGPAEAFERAKPLLAAMGQLVLHVGPHGHGSMTKLINNTLAAINAAALAEGLVVARRAQLDLDALLEVVAAGSGASAMLDLKAGPMLERDFEPLFKLEHMLKDLRHLLAEAEALGLRPPLAREGERAYAEAAGVGLGGRDFAAVYEAVESRSGA